MTFFILLRGFVLGLMVAAPVGPIGLLCVRRTLDRGTIPGFVTGLGAAVADTMFSAMAAFGVAALVGLLASHQAGLHILGGVVMLIFAAGAFSSGRTRSAAALSSAPPLQGLFRGFLTGLGLTLTNPFTLAGIFALVLTYASDLTHTQASVLVAGVFLGSACWWAILSSGTALVRHRVTPCGLMRINRVTGVALAGFGLYALINGARLFAGQV